MHILFCWCRLALLSVLLTVGLGAAAQSTTPEAPLAIEPSVTSLPSTDRPTGAPLPVELFAGQRQLGLQFVVNKKFAPTSRFGFFNLTTFVADYHNDPVKNTYLTNSALTCEVVGHFSVFAGLGINSTVGFRPNAGIDYVFISPTWLVVAEPSVDLTETHNLQTLALAECKPRLTDVWRLYLRAQVLYNYDPKAEAHDLSYLHLRLGGGYRVTQFGIGADFNRYGPHHVATNSFGVFVRRAFQ